MHLTVPDCRQYASCNNGSIFTRVLSILTGLNFLVTIHRMRAPGMTWLKMPLFPWTLYGTAGYNCCDSHHWYYITHGCCRRVLNIGFFDPSLGGDPLLYQHLFWTYSHPAVYIMILPAMGAISEIIPTFAKKSIFGYNFMVASTLAIAFVGYFVWDIICSPPG